MTPVATATTDRVPAAPTRGVAKPFLLVDTAAPAIVVAFLVLKYEPFVLLIDFPGSASSVVFPVLAVAVLAVTPTERLARIPILWSLSSFIVWLAASRLWSESSASTEFLIRSELPALVLVGLVAGTIEPRTLARTLTATFVAIVAWSLVASLVFPRSRELVYDAGLTEPQEGFRGTFGHKNQLGMFAVLAMALVLAFVRGRPRRVMLVVIIATVLGTRSATAGSGLFAVLFLWFWLAAVGSQRGVRERSLVLLASVVSAVLGVLLALRLLPTLLGVYQKDLTFSGRTLIWSESMKLVAEQPWAGYGYGALFSGDPPPITGELRRRIGFDAAHAHNGVVGLLLDVGVIGLALFTLVIVVAIVLAVRALRRDDTAPYGQWMLLTLFAILLMSLSEPVFEGPDLGVVMIAMVTSARALNDVRRRGQPLGGRSQMFARRIQSAGT